MQITKAAIQDIPQIKRLWNICFDKESKDYTDFFMSALSPDDFYVVKEDEIVVCAAVVPAQLEFNGCKGYYIYRVFTHPDYRHRKYATALVEYAMKDRCSSGCTFRIAPYTDEKTAEKLKTAGFDNIITQRRCQLEIKRNIWKNADFDIVTASRFRSVREKFSDEKIVHYTGRGYEVYTAFMYTCGGSTAESDTAYAVYYVEKDKLIVKEIFAQSVLYALNLLQAVRERTGIDTAVVYLSRDSTLFLGEGRKEPAFLTKGLPDDVYVNLMLD